MAGERRRSSSEGTLALPDGSLLQDAHGDVASLGHQIQQLGNRIVAEHEREVTALRQLNSRLEEQLQGDAVRAGGSCPPSPRPPREKKERPRGSDIADRIIAERLRAGSDISVQHAETARERMGSAISDFAMGVEKKDSESESLFSARASDVLVIPPTAPDGRAWMAPRASDGSHAETRVSFEVSNLPRIVESKERPVSPHDLPLPPKPARKATFSDISEHFEENSSGRPALTRRATFSPRVSEVVTVSAERHKLGSAIAAISSDQSSETPRGSAQIQPPDAKEYGRLGSMDSMASMPRGSMVDTHSGSPNAPSLPRRISCPEGDLQVHPMLKAAGDCKGRKSDIGELYLRSSLTFCSEFSRQRTKSGPAFSFGSYKLQFQCVCDWLPFQPNGSARTSHDMILVFVMLFDCIMQPFIIAWDIDITGYLSVLVTFTTIFWTISILMEFITGYYPPRGSSDPEMSFGPIAKRYLKSWFLPDVIIVGVDWVALTVASGQAPTTMRLARAARLLRCVRVFQFATAGRQIQVLQKVEALLDTASLGDVCQISVTIVKKIFYVCWLNHCGCCMWIAVGNFGRSSGRESWLDEAEESTNFDMRGSDMYLFGFLWSTTTMLGESPLAGKNTAELVFQAIWLITGLVVGSLIVSSLSEMMWQLADQKQEQTRKSVSLRRFLRQQKIDNRLAFAVQREISIRLDSASRLTEDDVPSLRLMSSALRIELRWVRVEHRLLTVPLLRTFMLIRSGFLKGLATRAVDYEFHRPGMLVFQMGNPGKAAYHVAHGCVEYTQGLITSEEVQRQNTTRDSRQKVRPPQWAALQALFIEWEHVGLFEALDNSELISVSVKGFAETLWRHPELLCLARGYAEAIAKRCMEVGTTSLTDVEEDCQWSHHGLLVLGMPPEPQATMAICCMEALTKQRSWLSPLSVGKGSIEDLEKEVHTGKSALVYDSTGRIVRVVSVAVLRLERDDNRILAQVGKWDPVLEAITDIKCVYPGRKVKPTETPLEALRATIQKGLEPFKDVAFVEQEVTVEEHDSPSFPGLQTCYLKTICSAYITEEGVETDVYRESRMDMISKQKLSLPRRTTTRRSNTLKDLGKVPTDFEAFVLKPTVGISSEQQGGDMGVQSSGVSSEQTGRRGASAKRRSDVQTLSERAEATLPVLMWLKYHEFHDFASKEGQINLREWIDAMDTKSSPSSAPPKSGSAPGWKPNWARAMSRHWALSDKSEEDQDDDGESGVASSPARWSWTAPARKSGGGGSEPESRHCQVQELEVVGVVPEQLW